MNKTETRGVAIDVCGTCAGIWFDRGELQKYFAREVKLHFAPAETSTACPRCSSSLHAIVDAKTRVPVKICPHHGVFADAASQSLLQKAPPRHPRIPKRVGVGAAAVGGAALATAALADSEEDNRRLETAADAAELGLEVGSELLDASGDVVSSASGVVDAAVEVTTVLLEGVLTLLGGFFEGL